jgi:hypothetical protein
VLVARVGMALAFPTEPLRGTELGPVPAVDIPADLPGRLRRWAAGRSGIASAVDLLIASPWLTDAGFVDACVVPVDGDVAVIDWAALAAFVTERSARGPASDALATLHRVHARARRSWTDHVAERFERRH